MGMILKYLPDEKDWLSRRFYGRNVSQDVYKNTENFQGFSVDMPF